MRYDVTVSLIGVVIILIIALLFFFWQKNIANDLLQEKGYGDEKRIGWLLFFMPLICWIYVCALPNKNK